MCEGTQCSEPVPLPALLRHARTTYGLAISAALAAAGYEDIPRNGVYVLGAIARVGIPLGQIIRELRVSKQAAGQLVDALVLRGYLERTVDADDRRRLTVTLTERGRAAHLASRSAVESVDGELTRRIGAECVEHARKTLHALIDIAAEAGRQTEVTENQ